MITQQHPSWITNVPWRLGYDLSITNVETGCRLPIDSFRCSAYEAAPLVISLYVQAAVYPGLPAVVNWLANSLADESCIEAAIKIECAPSGLSWIWFEITHCQDGRRGIILNTRPVAWTPRDIYEALEELSLSMGLFDDLVDIVTERHHGVLGILLFDQDDEVLTVPPVAAQGTHQTGNQVVKRRRAIPPKLRFEVLHRDGHTCQSCGAKASDGAQLHIDHIHPVSKGGTNDISNLQALCRDCNLGKGDRIL